jgi:hypothetical protein
MHCNVSDVIIVPPPPANVDILMWISSMFSGCKRGRNCEYIKPNTAAAKKKKTGHK